MTRNRRLTLAPDAAPAPIPYRAIVAAEVRAELARARVPAASLAAVLGIAQPNVSRRLNGHIAFTVDEIAAVAAALRVPPAAFLPDPATVPAWRLPHLDSNQEPAGFQPSDAPSVTDVA